MIDCDEMIYDNYVEVTTLSNVLAYIIANLGSFQANNYKSQRLDVLFLTTFVKQLDTGSNIISTQDSESSMFTPSMDLRNSLQLKSNQDIPQPMNIKSYFDVSYIDTDGDLRLMRGFAGCLSIFKKIK
jgi:hypothetical protein